MTMNKKKFLGHSVSHDAVYSDLSTFILFAVTVVCLAMLMSESLMIIIISNVD